MPDKPVSLSELNSQLKGNNKPSKSYDMTVDEIIRQSQTGELPTTITKKRVKETYKKVKGTEPKEDEVETISLEYLNSLLPKTGMGDVKVAESQDELINNLDLSLPPDQQIPRVTGNTDPLGLTEYTQDKKLTETEEQAKNIVNAPEQRFKKAYDNFKQGDVVKGGLETGMGLMEGVTIPFALGDLAMRQIPYVGNITADIMASPFIAVDEYMQFAQNTNKQLHDFLGIEKPDAETQQLIDEFERTAGQFIVAPFLLKGLKTTYNQLPFRQKKIMLEEIKNNLEKQWIEKKRQAEFNDAIQKGWEEQNKVIPPDPNLVKNIQNVQALDELGVNIKPEVKIPLQLEQPIRRITEVDPQGQAVVKPINPTGDLTNRLMTPEQVDIAIKNIETAPFQERNALLQELNRQVKMLPEFVNREFIVNEKGRVTVTETKPSGVLIPDNLTPEQLKESRQNIKQIPEVKDVEPYVYKPKNKVYENVTPSDVQGIQTLIALEKEFNTAKQTGQPYPLSNIEHPMVKQRLNMESGATVDRLHQLTNAVKEYNGLEKSTKKIQVERPLNESIEVYPPKPEFRTETGQGEVLKSKPNETISSQIEQPLNVSNEAVFKEPNKTIAELAFELDDAPIEWVHNRLREIGYPDDVIANMKPKTKSEAILTEMPELANLQKEYGADIYTKYRNLTPKEIREVAKKVSPPDANRPRGVEVPKVDKRFITDEMVAEADRIMRSSPDQLSANPFDYYGKMGKAYVIKGARLIEDGIINFKEWSRKMIDEFGTDIAPILKQLYDDAKGFMTDAKKPKEPEVKTQESAKEVISNAFTEAEKKYGKVDKYLYDQNATPEVRTKQQQMLNEVLSDKMNFEHTVSKGGRKLIKAITDRVFDQFYNMTKRYGANGSEMLYKLHDGNQTVTRIYKTIYPFLSKVKEISKTLEPSKLNEYNKLTRKALEDRNKAETILGNDPLLKEYYESAREFYDAFREELKGINVKTVDDYYTRIKQQDMFDQLGKDIDLIADKDGAGWFALNQVINADTPFVKPRTGVMPDIAEHIPLVMERYFYNMSKYIAYKNAIDYYYGDFTKAMPRLLRHNSLRPMADLIRENLDPRFLQSKTLMTLRDQVYVTALWNNPKSVLANALQRRLTDFYVTRDAYNIAKQTYKKDTANYPQKLYQITNELIFEIPDYMEMGVQEGLHSRYRNAMQTGRWFGEKTPKAIEYLTKDRFQSAERNNWQFAHIAGVFDVLVKMPEYKRLLAEGKTPFQIAEQLLQNNKVYEQAYRRAVEIGNRTQFGAMTFNRPVSYNSPVWRLASMFTRFKFGQWQVMRDSFRKLEGVDSLLSQNILRKGMTEDAYPVEVLREVSNARTGLEGYSKRLTDPNAKKVVNEYINFLKKQEGELNSIIKTLEPIKPRKEVMTKWLKYYTALSAVSFGWQLLSNWIQYALDDNKSKPELDDMLVKTLYDLSPAPFYGTNPQQMFKSPLLPNLEMRLYGNWNWKGLTKETIRYGMKVTPLGILDRFAFGLPSKKLGELITGDDEVTNPRAIREIETRLRKERDKKNPDLNKIKELERELELYKYKSEHSEDYKNAERERYFKGLEKERKLNPDKMFIPQIDSMKFEQQWNKKLLNIQP